MLECFENNAKWKTPGTDGFDPPDVFKVFWIEIKKSYVQSYVKLCPNHKKEELIISLIPKKNSKIFYLKNCRLLKPHM